MHTNTTTTRLRAHHNLLFKSHLAKVLTLVVVLDRKQAIESSKQRSASLVMSTWARAVPHPLPSAMTNAGALDPRATGLSKSNAVCANVAITSRRVGGVPPRWFPPQRYLGTPDATAGTLSPERFASVA